MGFFDNTDDIQDGKFDSGGGGFEPIPNNTNLLVVADAAEWKSYEGVRSISITWVVLAPAAYKNRKVFQSIKVFDADSAKQKRARTMLKAVDMNCGGQLALLQSEPADVDLMKAIMGKQIVIKVQKWEIKDEQGNIEKDGNWVSAVSPKAPVDEVPAAPQQAVVQEQKPAVPF